MAAIKTSCGNAPASRNGGYSSKPPKIRSCMPQPMLQRLHGSRSPLHLAASQHRYHRGLVGDQQPESAAPSGRHERRPPMRLPQLRRRHPPVDCRSKPQRATSQGRQHDQDWRGNWSWREALGALSGPIVPTSERAYGRHSREARGARSGDQRQELTHAFRAHVTEVPRFAAQLR
jgi:hypothetical protein